MYSLIVHRFADSPFVSDVSCPMTLTDAESAFDIKRYIYGVATMFKKKYFFVQNRLCDILIYLAAIGQHTSRKVSRFLYPHQKGRKRFQHFSILWFSFFSEPIISIENFKDFNIKVNVESISMDEGVANDEQHFSG